VQELPFFLNFSKPAAWLVILWGGYFFPALYIALLRPTEGESKEKNSILRRAGFEVSFVIVPFAIYAVIHIGSSNLDTLLKSPELPMASLLLCFMSLRWILITSKVVPRQLDVEKARFLNGAIAVMVMLILILLLRLVTAQFNSEQSVSSWYGVVNSALFIFSFYLAYGIIGAMMMSKELHEDESLT